MYGFSMETTLVLLEKPALHRREIPLHNRHCSHVRHNVLGPWRQNVSKKKLSKFKTSKTKQNSLLTKFEFFVTCRKTTQDLSNAMGSMYTAVLFLGLQNAASVQPVVNVERTVFYREQAAGMYSAMPYAFAQVLKQNIRE